VIQNNLKAGSDEKHHEIAVIVLTYNQATILHECLDSILSQKLDSAKLKIYVIDDASTDGTKSIIEKYQEKHPDLIFPVLHATNQYQIGNAPELSTLKSITSSHVAFCDGDDFWIDEFKLEKQLQKFLQDESLSIVHTDYCFGKEVNSVIHLEARNEKDKQKAKRIKNAFDLIQGNDIKKSTAMFRASTLDFNLLGRCIGIRAQDWVIAIGAGSNGGVLYIEDLTTCYRVSNNASFQSLDQDEKLRIKDEVRWFCATNLPEGKLRHEFRNLLKCHLLQSNRHGFRNRLKCTYCSQ
jgi:glycosyltransferase involved in cell wall biosynthesis